MFGWHHWLNGHEFEETQGNSERQGRLECCSPLGCKELDTTERLNNNKNIYVYLYICIYIDMFFKWLNEIFSHYETSLVAQTVKNLPAMWKTWVRSLGQEDPLEKGTATPVFLPGESHGQRSLADYSPWSHNELDTTEWLRFSHIIEDICFTQSPLI